MSGKPCSARARSAAGGAAAGARTASRTPRCRCGQRRRVQRARPTLASQLRVPGTARETIEATMTPVTPGYFETMKIPLLAGRTSSAAISTPAPDRRHLNESFAKRYFGGDRRSAAVRRVRHDPRPERDRRRRGRYSLRPPQAPGADGLHPAAAAGPRHAACARRWRSTRRRQAAEEVRAATPLFSVTTITSQKALVNRRCCASGCSRCSPGSSRWSGSC